MSEIKNTDRLFDISETVIGKQWVLLFVKQFNGIDLEFRRCCDTIIAGYWYDYEDRKRFRNVCRIGIKENSKTPFDGMLKEFEGTGLKEFVLDYIKD